MKNLRKMLAVVSASAVMLAAVPVFADTTVSGDFKLSDGSASAVSANYENFADNEITVTVDTTKASVGTEMTFIILDEAVTDQIILNNGVTSTDILHIDQKTLKNNDNAFLVHFGRGLVDDELPESEEGYPIRVGYYDQDGNFAIASTRMIVSKGSADEYVTITIVWGDVDNDGSISVFDASAIVMRAVGGETEFAIDDRDETLVMNDEYEILYDEGKTYSIVWGDVDNDGSISVFDASAIVMRAVGGETEFAIDGSDDTFVMSEEYDLIIE